MGYSDVHHEPADRPVFAWVLDDTAADRKKIAEALESVGVLAEKLPLARVPEKIEEIEEGGGARPDLIVIDQHWKSTGNTLEALTGDDRPIDKSVAGMAIGRHLRSKQDFNRSTLVMTSGYAAGLQEDVSSLGLAVTVPKADLYDLTKAGRAGKSAIEALRSLGIDVHRSMPRSSDEKVIQFIASSLGLKAADVPCLSGAYQQPEADVNTRDLLGVSRDSETRIKILTKIMVSLREMYGRKLPAASAMERELGLPLRRIMLHGSIFDLLEVQWDLETRGGGTLS